MKAVAGGTSSSTEDDIAKHKWKWIFALLLTALTGLVDVQPRARRQGFHWQTFLATMGSLQWTLATAGCPVRLVTYYIRAAALGRAHPAGQPASTDAAASLSATVIGFTAVTLFGRPGEFVRPYLISLKERVPFSSQLAAWLLERIFDLLIALVVFGYALAHVRTSGATVGPALSWVLAIGGRFVGCHCHHQPRHFRAYCVIFPIPCAAACSIRSPLPSPSPAFSRAERLVNAFVQGAEATRSELSLLILLTIYTALEWVAIAACYLCITRAFGRALHFGWTDVLIFMGFVSFGSIVQIPGIGGGVQVVTILVLTELFQVPLEIATSLALLLWIIMFVVIVPVGILLAVREGLDWAKLRSMAREAEL